MKTSAPIWRIRLVALLTLAFILVGPLADHGSASAQNQTAQSVTLDAPSHSDKSGQHRHLNANTDVDCDGAALGCCMMAQCCPGISVSPHTLFSISDDDETTAASVILGTGCAPWIVLPPPRPALI